MNPLLTLGRHAADTTAAFARALDAEITHRDLLDDVVAAIVGSTPERISDLRAGECAPTRREAFLLWAALSSIGSRRVS